ncbi:hypothetical protein ACN47E_000268 [Coniothyrium glycines]
MVFELHVWGPAFGLPSIEPECIAIVAYCQGSHTEPLPILFDDDVATATGFEDIVAYLRNHPAIDRDLDANLTSQQRNDRTALVTFLQSTAMPLIDLSLYVSAENYNTTTSSAYTAILPWYANYTIPPKRRDLARSRTAHMGLSSLDVDRTAEEAFVPGRGTASAEYEAAKKAAGIPTESQPNTLNMGRTKGFGGLFGGSMYAARFKLDALSSELSNPIADLLGKHEYLLGRNKPSSLDCLAFGYLSLLYYPDLPQSWLKETIETKHPSVAKYIRALRQQLLENEDVIPADVWAVSSGAESTTNSLLPWKPMSAALSSRVLRGANELLGNIPGISRLVRGQRTMETSPRAVSTVVKSTLPSPFFISTMIGATFLTTIGLAFAAIHHRRSPREGPLIFWAMRSSFQYGEAGNILSALAPQLPSYSQL